MWLETGRRGLCFLVMVMGRLERRFAVFGGGVLCVFGDGDGDGVSCVWRW